MKNKCDHNMCMGEKNSYFWDKSANDCIKLRWLVKMSELRKIKNRPVYEFLPKYIFKYCPDCGKKLK